MQEFQDSHVLIETLKMTALGSFIKDHQVAFGEATVYVHSSDIAQFIENLSRDRMCEFKTLVDITAIDNLGAVTAENSRFTLVYHLLSMTQNQRLRVCVMLEEDQSVESVCSTHPSANWFEREVFDMFGIVFKGHPDLRRILTDYGFDGHPLRKDFPTTGYLELRYDDVIKKCVYEPVELVQDYRQFDFLSPWESAEYILPGDEKKA